jgi:hypothetical protein
MAGGTSTSDRVRQYVRRTYLDPARRKGDKQVRVVAGDVHAGLDLRNRIPLVCNALRSRALQRAGNVRIVGDEGPPSGQSTTVAITYEILPIAGHAARGPAPASRREAFVALRGIARQAFSALGGGENVIRRERERFATRDEA